MSIAPIDRLVGTLTADQGADQGVRRAQQRTAGATFESMSLAISDLIVETLEKGVYRPIWKYGAPTLGEYLSAHLVFGGATSPVFAALTREQP